MRILHDNSKKKRLSIIIDNETFDFDPTLIISSILAYTFTCTYIVCLKLERSRTLFEQLTNSN